MHVGVDGGQIMPWCRQRASGMQPWRTHTLLNGYKFSFWLVAVYFVVFAFVADAYFIAWL